MTYYQFEKYNPHSKTRIIIDQANEIIEEYSKQGFDLTLRQLYYQFVTKNYLANKQENYEKLGKIISKARRGGFISWDAIVDRTRGVQKWGSYNSPQEFLKSKVYSYQKDLWEDQEYYIEVWFEKDALEGIFSKACGPYRVPFFSCRGYASDSSVYEAACRMQDSFKPVIVLHFGDHDPSGIDMTRDIEDRLRMFEVPDLEVIRVALNRHEIEQYRPPPNPAKEQNSRFKEYQKIHGNYSWELDALSPTIIKNLLDREISSYIDKDRMNKVIDQEKSDREKLIKIANELSNETD